MYSYDQKYIENCTSLNDLLVWLSREMHNFFYQDDLLFPLSNYYNLGFVQPFFHSHSPFCFLFNILDIVYRLQYFDICLTLTSPESSGQSGNKSPVPSSTHMPSSSPGCSSPQSSMTHG